MAAGLVKTIYDIIVYSLVLLIPGKLMNPFSHQNPNSHKNHQSPNGLSNIHHPSESEIEDLQFNEYDPRVVKNLKNSFLSLVVIGLVLGLFIAAGVVYIMNRLDINAQPPGNSSIQQVQ